MSKNLYFNARISTEGATRDTSLRQSYKASYSIDIPQGLLKDPSRAVFSVIRFTSSLHGLMALFVKHPPGGESSDETLYRFSMRYNGTVLSRPVYWFPADRSLLPTTGDYGDDYWNEYSYFRMTMLLNDTLQKLTAELMDACPGLTLAPPFFHYDSQSATFALYYPAEMLEGPDPVELFCSEEARHLMNGFPFAETSEIPGIDAEFLCFLQSPADLPVSIGGVQYYRRDQIPGALTTWSPIRRIVLTTQSLGLTSEIVSQLTASTNGPGVPSSTTTAQKIFCDMAPVLTRGDELVTGNVDYAPTAQYRIVNFNNNDPVTKFDFDICWEDPNGALHVLPLTYGSYCSVKCDFISGGCSPITP